MNTIHENKDLQNLLNTFSVDQGNYTFSKINQGYINDTFLVLEHGQPLYILQRINSVVFSNVPAVMSNMSNTLSYLKDKEYSTVALVPTKTGELFCELKHQDYWRLIRYVPNSIAYDIALNTKVAHEAGKILGKFHSLLQNATSDQFVDTIPQFHDLKLRKVQFQEAMNNASQERLHKAIVAIEFVTFIFPQLSELSSLKLPSRICHNDTKLNNILFSKKTNQALCFIDLDTIMKGYFYYDFGDLVRTIANTGKEDEKNHDKITFDKIMFESLLDGLKTTSNFLTPPELKSLPLGVVFMPFIHGLRALTDYLNNDTYYKVSYVDQNLDRSLSLLDFSKKALLQIHYIEAMVTKKLQASGN
ncbi:phosphotransferase enzyme family protein [Sediminicola arcticus]|jgi:Ser/Thr protein kinase RdoA (MazF antagonist)|uniref:Aminoglycoside phosphotransferase family protein n=1 Tax=Sediminicola arcticus TaxID=1574308 RepID=A0ABV2SVX4_9FLAO